jgi:hypothetical protein
MPFIQIKFVDYELRLVEKSYMWLLNLEFEILKYYTLLLVSWRM